MAAAVAPGSRSGAHPRHGRDAAGPVDGPAGHVRRPQERRRSRAGGRHLPGGPAVQGECAERQRHRQHGGQDVAPDRLSGPFAGGVLLGHRLVQRLLRTVNQRNIIIVYNFSNNNNCRLGERRSGVGDSVPLKENIRSRSLPRSILKKKKIIIKKWTQRPFYRKESKPPKVLNCIPVCGRYNMISYLFYVKRENIIP